MGFPSIMGAIAVLCFFSLVFQTIAKKHDMKPSCNLLVTQISGAKTLIAQTSSWHTQLKMEHSTLYSVPKIIARRRQSWSQIDPLFYMSMV